MNASFCIIIFFMNNLFKWEFSYILKIYNENRNICQSWHTLLGNIHTIISYLKNKELLAAIFIVAKWFSLKKELFCDFLKSFLFSENSNRWITFLNQLPNYNFLVSKITKEILIYLQFHIYIFTILFPFLVNINIIK